MATNFPTSVDDASTVGDDTHPSADEALSSTDGGPAHHSLHQNVGLAINAIEDKVGTGASTPAANSVLTGTGSGTSAWATISTAMIGDDQVTQAKIADDAVGADQLAANAVVTASIVDDNVTQAKIAAGAVGNTQLADMGANTVKIRQSTSGAPQNVEIGTNAVLGRTTGALISTQVQEGMIADNAVTAAKLADNAVDASHLQGSTLASGVTASSLTSVGTLSSLTVSGNITSNSGGISGATLSISGTAEIDGILDVNNDVRLIDGTVGSPSLTFDADRDTGIYRNATNQFALVANGVGGLIVAAGTVNTAGLETTTTSGYRYVLRNNTYGTLYNFTSSGDLKENITNVTASDAGAWIDALQPVTFNERWLQEGPESDEDRAFREADVQVGFIAEDVLANSTTAQFAQVEDVDGTLKGVGWKWECVIAAAVAEIKSLRARVATLEGN